MEFTYNYKCCVCGSAMEEYNKANQCINCMQQEINLSEDLETDFVHECRRCGRWETSKKKWKRCEWESADLLGVVLKLIKIKKGGPMIKDASFVYTEEHSMRIKVKLLLEKEIVKNTSMSQTHVVEFEIKNRQCVDCEREFTPHTWNTVVQVRQRCEHARTFNQLESLLTKNKTLDKLLKVERQDEGIDFYFASKSSSARFIEYLKGWVVGKEKQSKHLKSPNLLMGGSRGIFSHPSASY